MTDTVLQSFCERCGTRYTATEPERKSADEGNRGMLARFGRRGSDEPVPDDLSVSTAAPSSDHFAGTFHFCMDCRQYACTKCWNTEAGGCLNCRPLGTEQATNETSSPFSTRVSSAWASKDSTAQSDVDEWGRPKAETPPADAPIFSPQESADGELDPWRGVVFSQEEAGKTGTSADGPAPTIDFAAERGAPTPTAEAWPEVDQRQEVEAASTPAAAVWPEVDREDDLRTVPASQPEPATPELEAVQPQPEPVAEPIEVELVDEPATQPEPEEASESGAEAQAETQTEVASPVQPETSPAPVPEAALPSVAAELAPEPPNAAVAAEAPGSIDTEPEVPVLEAEDPAAADVDTEPATPVGVAADVEPEPEVEAAVEPELETPTAPEADTEPEASLAAKANAAEAPDETEPKLASEPDSGVEPAVAPIPRDDATLSQDSSEETAVYSAAAALGISAFDAHTPEPDSTPPAPAVDEGTPELEPEFETSPAADAEVAPELEPAAVEEPAPQVTPPSVETEPSQPAVTSTTSEVPSSPPPAAPPVPTTPPVSEPPAQAPSPIVPITAPSPAPSIEVWATPAEPGPFNQPYQAPTAATPTVEDLPPVAAPTQPPPLPPEASPPPPPVAAEQASPPPPVTSAAPVPPPVAPIQQAPAAVPPPPPAVPQSPPPSVVAPPAQAYVPPPAPPQQAPPAPPQQAPPRPQPTPKGVATQQCANCGLSLSAKARFCRRCGAPQA